MQGAFKGALLFFVTLFLCILFVGKNEIHYTIPPENKKIPKVYNPSNHYYNVQIISLEGASCSATVISNNLAITAEHCVVTSDGKFSSFKVFNKNRKFITYAEVYAPFPDLDIAMIIGNFEKIEKAKYYPKNFNFFNDRHHFVTCGFATGLEYVCTPFIPISNEIFMYKGQGFLRPGMSGGGVFDLDTGEIVGVNSAAGVGYVLISPIFGISLKYDFTFPE